jgi:hypothetical protein
MALPLWALVQIAAHMSKYDASYGAPCLPTKATVTSHSSLTSWQQSRNAGDDSPTHVRPSSMARTAPPPPRGAASDRQLWHLAPHSPVDSSPAQPTIRVATVPTHVSLLEPPLPPSPFPLPNPLSANGKHNLSHTPHRQLYRMTHLLAAAQRSPQCP